MSTKAQCATRSAEYTGSYAMTVMVTFVHHKRGKCCLEVQSSPPHYRPLIYNGRSPSHSVQILARTSRQLDRKLNNMSVSTVMKARFQRRSISSLYPLFAQRISSGRKSHSAEARSVSVRKHPPREHQVGNHCLLVVVQGSHLNSTFCSDARVRRPPKPHQNLKSKKKVIYIYPHVSSRHSRDIFFSEVLLTKKW